MDQTGSPYAGELGNIRPGIAVQGSTDGGRTWTTILQPSGGAWTIDPVNAEVGYVFATESAEVTHDAGHTWSAAREPAAGPVVWAQFASPVDGYGLTAHDQLVHTTDGAKTWTTLSSPAAAIQGCFTSATTGYLINEAGAVFASTDSGQTWSQAEPAPPRVAQFPTYDPTISCGGPSVTVAVPLICAAACGGSGGFSLLRSENAGGTWTTESTDEVGEDTDIAAVATDADFSVAVIYPTENSAQFAPDSYGLYKATATAPGFTRSTTPSYPSSPGSGTGTFSHMDPLSVAHVAVYGNVGWALIGATFWTTTNDGATWAARPA